jgi:hypothetical protein
MFKPGPAGGLPFVGKRFQPPKIYGRLGSLEVRLARKKSEIRRAQRLRYKVFYEEMSAIPNALAILSRRDEDAYDAIFDHLLVIDHGDTNGGRRWRRRSDHAGRSPHSSVAPRTPIGGVPCTWSGPKAAGWCNPQPLRLNEPQHFADTCSNLVCRFDWCLHVYNSGNHFEFFRDIAKTRTVCPLARVRAFKVYLINNSCLHSTPRGKRETVAQSSTRVSSFMRNIDGSSYLRNPELEVVETKKENAVGATFVLYADQSGSGADAEASENTKPKRRVASMGG